jgi:hypothetical protein
MYCLGLGSDSWLTRPRGNMMLSGMCECVFISLNPVTSSMRIGRGHAGDWTRHLGAEGLQGGGSRSEECPEPCVGLGKSDFPRSELSSAFTSDTIQRAYSSQWGKLNARRYDINSLLHTYVTRKTTHVNTIVTPTNRDTSTISMAFDLGSS